MSETKRPPCADPGQRTLQWKCPSCRIVGTLSYQRPNVDIIKCPKCKVSSIAVAGDLRERDDFSEEVRFQATGEAPRTVGHPNAPLRAKRQPPRQLPRAQDEELVRTRRELDEAIGAAAHWGRVAETVGDDLRDAQRSLNHAFDYIEQLTQERDWLRAGWWFLFLSLSGAALVWAALTP